MGLKKRWPAAGFFLALVLLGAVLISRSQTSVQLQPPREPLDLTVPSRAVVESWELAPSNLGYFAWVSGPALTFRFRALHAGDVVKVKALAQCGPSSWELVLDDEVIAVIRWADRFQEVRLVLPRGGQKLQLRRLDQTFCPLHFSRVKRQGFLGTTGEGPGQLYLISSLKPAPLAAPWSQVLPPWVLALLVTSVLWWLGQRWALYGLLFSAANLWVLQVYGWLAGVWPVYPPATLRLVLFAPQVLVLAVLLPKRLVTFCNGRWRSWAFSRAFSQLARPVPSAWIFPGAVGVYLFWLVVTLPQTPMELDEVLFARGVVKFDVLAHAPHPPGYPLYVGLAEVFFGLGVAPHHAAQLASVVGALLALGGVLWLGKLLKLSGLGLFLVGLWTVTLPAFSFAANVGLSDMLATGLLLMAVLAVFRLGQEPTVERALAAGAVTALACGVRPQVFLALLGPWAVVSLMLSRKRLYRWLWSFPAAFFVSLAVWLPVLVFTGWRRYWAATRHLASWMDAHEYLSRFPAMEFSRFVADWLVRPLGNATLAWGFWLACGLGGYLLWQKGQRHVVSLLLSGGLGYLLLAPWTMTAEACVRYALPAYVLLAPLAAGLVSWEKSRWAGTTVLASLSVAGFTWVVPALTLRAAEANPVWAALSWVRQTQHPQVVYVDGGIAPHAVFVLKPAGFRVQARNPEHPVPGLWVRSPALAQGSELLFKASWSEPKVGLMARRRYLSAEVVRFAPVVATPSTALPRGGNR